MGEQSGLAAEADVSAAEAGSGEQQHDRKDVSTAATEEEESSSESHEGTERENGGDRSPLCS